MCTFSQLVCLKARFAYSFTRSIFVFCARAPKFGNVLNLISKWPALWHCSCTSERAHLHLESTAREPRDLTAQNVRQLEIVPKSRNLNEVEVAAGVSLSALYLRFADGDS